MGKLTALKVRALTEPGLYGDGDTLFLRVAPGGSKSWVQRIAINGKRTDLGLGGVALVSLQEAREAAFENRRLARRGGDPLAAKRKAGVPTFREAAEQTFAANRPRWKNGKHTENWMRSLELYVFPTLGNSRVDRISQQDVLRVLSPLWAKRAATARKVRQRMGMTFRWARAHGFIENNPAEAVEGALPVMPRVKAHFRAAPYGEVREVLEIVEASGAGAAAKLAFRFVVLTAARSGEARKATWSEIDLEARTWTVPAERMGKTGVEHRVPLSAEALRVLAEARKLHDGEYLFPSPVKRGEPLSDMALTKLLRTAGLAERCTVHGMRASFRTWASEQTRTEHAVMELALSHTVGNAVEQAYSRGDLLEKRRTLMQKWSDYVTASTSGKVVKLHG